MSDLPLRQIIEGAILAADSPLNVDHMIQLFESAPPSRAEIREVIDEIAESCEGRGFELKKVASGYRFQIRTEYGSWVSRLWDERAPRYSRALLETLSLIAYRQPITRGDIEDVRGVTVSTNIIRALLEREWIRVVGHRDVPGRPAMFATTKNFLDYFNLTSLDELPPLSEIKDLDKVNEELDLDDGVIEARVIELDEMSTAVPDPVSDDELDRVTEEVNAISSNIRNLFAEDDEAEDELEDAEPGPASTQQDESAGGGTLDASSAEGSDQETDQ